MPENSFYPFHIKVFNRNSFSKIIFFNQNFRNDKNRNYKKDINTNKTSNKNFRKKMI